MLTGCFGPHPSKTAKGGAATILVVRKGGPARHPHFWQKRYWDFGVRNYPECVEKVLYSVAQVSAQKGREPGAPSESSGPCFSRARAPLGSHGDFLRHRCRGLPSRPPH